MVEQSYVLAGGPYGSWAGFPIRQEGGERGRTCTGAPEEEQLERSCTDKSDQQPLTLHLNA